MENFINEFYEDDLKGANKATNKRSNSNKQKNNNTFNVGDIKRVITNKKSIYNILSGYIDGKFDNDPKFNELDDEVINFIETCQLDKYEQNRLCEIINDFVDEILKALAESNYFYVIC